MPENLHMTFSVIAKGCLEILTGKAYGKSVALPSIIYDVNVLNTRDQDINKLQRTVCVWNVDKY